MFFFTHPKTHGFALFELDVLDPSLNEILLVLHIALLCLKCEFLHLILNWIGDPTNEVHQSERSLIRHCCETPNNSESSPSWLVVCDNSIPLAEPWQKISNLLTIHLTLRRIPDTLSLGYGAHPNNLPEYPADLGNHLRTLVLAHEW